jgi:hypothetical protein
MSLVNALINQIGREIGRDVYYTAKRSLLNDFGSKRSKASLNLPVNQQLLLKIEEVKKSKSELEVEQLRNFVHEISDHVDSSTGDWDDVFVATDQLIDARKVNSSPSELIIFNEIDQLNLTNYRLKLESHQQWVREQIEILNKEEVVNWKVPNKMLLFFFSIFGSGSGFLLRGIANTVSEFLIPWFCGVMVYAGMMSNARGDKSLNLLALFGVLIYCLTILGNFFKRSDLIKKRNGILNSIDQLKVYYQEIMQITL